ncbi:sarcosine oxidase subunit gamma [Pelagibius sp. Alg239-R121]|uniref:sarcosine oxidase subunit gamma n=1 Tax=Pelagibius sp. Alg239-R121 TaxID=2993448 RepID=UPI0024A6C01B|nr:sarcosine oxidase subunit gamma family protein [Pelagibius sp. Alg239-R121]
MNVQNPIQFEPITAAHSGPVELTILPEATRFNLRIDPAGLAAASTAFGVDLPERIGGWAESATRSAICLGPDEWVLLAEETDRQAIEASFAGIYSDVPHSLTDISDREIAIEITGDRAAELLTVACPRNLDAIAPGSGVRTLFDSAQVVLYRDTSDKFRIEVWRSFFPHVWELLIIANKELASGL